VPVLEVSKMKIAYSWARYIVCAGHLARAGGALTVDIVELDSKRAFEWLRNSSSSEHRRIAAVLILKGMYDMVLVYLGL